MDKEAKGISEVKSFVVFSFFLIGFLKKDMSDILHDGDLFMNLTLDDIEDVVDGIVDTVDSEIQNINVKFNEFVDKLLDDIRLNDLKIRVDDIVELFDNQTLIVEDVNGVISVKTKIVSQLGDLVTDCKDLPLLDTALCDTLSTISTDLGNINIEEIPAPDENLVQKVHDIGELFDDVTSEIENINISEILSQLSEEVRSISDYVSEELSSVDDIQEQIFRSNKIPSTMDDIYSNYLQHVNTGFLGVGGFLAFILTFVLIGLFCGISQKSSKCGSWSICSTLSVFFIAGIFLFLICMTLLVVGAFTQKLLCDTLNEPESSEMIPLLDTFLNDAFNDAVSLNDVFNLSIPVIISGIHQGLPVYPLLQLENIYDIDELTNWKEDFGIDSIIESTMESIDTVISGVTDLENDIFSQEGDITNLAKALDNELNPILDLLLDTDQINQPILTSKSQLDGFIDNLPPDQDQPDFSSFVESLRGLSSEIGYLEGNITTVQEDFNDILDIFGNGTRDLDLTSFVEETFSIVENAFDLFPNEVSTFVDETIDDLLGAVDEEIPNIIDSVNTVGGTLPLSNIYNATYTHVCLEMVSPLNSGRYFILYSIWQLYPFSLVWVGMDFATDFVPALLVFLLAHEDTQTRCFLTWNATIPGQVLPHISTPNRLKPNNLTRTRTISMHDLSPATYNLSVRPVTQYNQNPHYGNGQQGNRNYNNNVRKY